MVKLWGAILILTVAVSACSSGGSHHTPAQEAATANSLMVDSIKNNLKNGDIVTRSGISWESDQIRDFQVKDKLFTHAGMAKKINGQWMICHITGRDSIYYPDDLTHYELLDSFVSPVRCSAFGHFRFALDSAENERALQFMDDCVTKKLRFDIFFDMKNDSLMTCTEMISKAIAGATAGRIQVGFTPVTERRHVIMIKRVYRRYKPKDSEVIGRPIVAVDDITTHKACRELHRYFYQYP